MIDLIEEKGMRFMAKRFSPRNVLNFFVIIFIITFCYTIGRKQLSYFLETEIENTLKSEKSLQIVLEEPPESANGKNQENSLQEKYVQEPPTTVHLKPYDNVLEPQRIIPKLYDNVQEPQSIISEPYDKIQELQRIISPKPYNNVQFILVVSSLGRSGTSWIGELLCTQRKSFYIYEPDYYIVQVLNRTMNDEKGVKAIRSQFLCDFSEDFMSYVRLNRTSPSHTFRSLYTKYCRDKNRCLTSPNIQNNCFKSKIRIIKTIRFSLEFVGNLLADESIPSLKVVYIIRDPRAALASRERLGWTADPEKNCNILEEDLKWYKSLKTRFSERIYLLRYEDLCLNISGDGLRLWQFISGNNEEPIPKLWIRFFNEHSESPKEELPYQVKRDPQVEWLNWRKELRNETQLKTIENFCLNPLIEFGYNLLGSLNAVQNLTFPSLTSKEKCPKIPCREETLLKDDV